MAIKSFGVTVSVGGTAVLGLVDVSLPEVAVTDIDVTTHASTDSYREFIGGLKDGGVMTLSGKYLIADTGQVKLRDKAQQGGNPVAIVVEFSDNSTASFNAVIKGYGVSNPLDEDVTFTSSLKISGPVTYAVGA